MHKMTILAAVFLILVFCSVLSAAPKLAFQHSYFDFGYAPQQAKLTHTFWIKSVGDETLKISKVSTGCSCTKAPLTKKEIEPGDSADLAVTFNTGHYKYRTLKKPTIFSNEGEGGRSVTLIANLVVHSDSTAPLLINPYIVKMPLQGEGSRIRGEFNIKNVSDTELQLNMVEFPEEYLSVDLPDSIAPGGEARGYVRLTEKGIKNTFEKSFTFEVNNKEKTRYSLCISRLMQSEMIKSDTPIERPSSE